MTKSLPVQPGGNTHAPVRAACERAMPLQLAWGAAILSLASAATLFVAPTGAPGGACSAAAPCDFTTALTRAGPGDVVSAASGNYSTPLSLARSGRAGARITIAAASPGTVFVPNVTFASASYTTLDGVSVARAVGNGVTMKTSHHVVISNAELRLARESGGALGSAIGSRAFVLPGCASLFPRFPMPAQLLTQLWHRLWRGT